MTVTLPSIDTFFFREHSKEDDQVAYLPSPAKTTSAHDDDDDDDDDDLPSLRLPLPTPKDIHIGHARRVSTCSTSSAPSLTYSPSPSPSPPPTRPASPEPFLLVPCPMELANAVVIVPNRLGNNNSSNSSNSTNPSRPRLLHPTPPVFRPCKPSEARALLLIGPAISTHARKASVRMHPYRIVRERRA